MSAPRLVVCGLEPGPALALAAGALLAAFADERAVRPVLLGADLPLWRLLYGASARTPRVLDPRLLDDAAAGSSTTSGPPAPTSPPWWRSSRRSTAGPASKARGHSTSRWRWTRAGARGGRPRARGDGRRLGLRGQTADAGGQFAGVIVVGGDEKGRAEALRGLIEETASLPVLGWVPPRLSEQFARQYGGAQGSLRRIGPQPVKGGEAALCREAATYLDRTGIEAAAARRGFLPARPRRLLAPLPAATGLKLAVAWGAPLEPFVLEAIDLFKAQGLELEPVHLEKDEALPAGAAGLYIAGLLDEEHLEAFAANEALKTSMAEAIAAGLPTLALGGGALLLLRRLADSRGRTHELAGVLRERPNSSSGTTGRATWRPRPPARTPTRRAGPTLYELFDLEFLTLQQEAFAWRLGGVEEGQVEGFVHERCLATTLVPSLPAMPGLAAGFVAAMRSAAPDASSLVAVESRLRTRRGLVALWLVTTAAVTLVTVLMEVGGVPGGTTPPTPTRSSSSARRLHLLGHVLVRRRLRRHHLRVRLLLAGAVPSPTR